MQNKYDLSDLAPKQGNQSQNNQFDLSDLAPPQKESTGFKGIGQDILQGIKGIPSAIGGVPGQLEGIKEQYQNEPSRIGKNLLAGIGEAGIGALNMPHEAIKYLGKKELIPDWLKKYNELPFTHIPDLGIEEKMGLGEQKPGDSLLRLIPQLVGGYGAKKAFGKPTLSALEKHLEESKNFIEEKGKHHKTYLGEGQEHAARASQGMLDYIEGKFNPETGRREGGLRQQIGSQYDKLAEDMSHERVTIERTPDMKAIQKEITKLGKGVSGAEKEKLMKILGETGSKQTVNGADALTAYRELKRQKRKASQSAHEPGVGPKEHEDWIKKAEHIGALESKMKAMLENQIGGNYLERLKTIDKEYSTKIAPLSENSMYQEMRKHGQTSKNIMKYLHGKTKGNDTLNTLVANDPELQRVIVGQKFASNPEKLTQSTELLSPYQKMNPVISKILEEQQGIKHAKEIRIPELEKEIKKIEEKKRSRKNFRKGLYTGAGAAGYLASGRDWKEDLPMIASVLALNRGKK